MQKKTVGSWEREAETGCCVEDCFVTCDRKTERGAHRCLLWDGLFCDVASSVPYKQYVWHFTSTGRKQHSRHCNQKKKIETAMYETFSFSDFLILCQAFRCHLKTCLFVCLFVCLCIVAGRLREATRFATHWKLLDTCTSCNWTVRGSNPGGGEIFRTRPDRPWGLHSLLYNGY